MQNYVFLKALLALSIFGLAYSTYNPTYGLMFTEYSEVTYCNDKNQAAWNCGAPCQRVQALQDVRVLKYKLMEAQGIIGYNQPENAIVIAFRGTVPWEIQNWISDIDTIKTRYPLCGNNCEVHEGFFRAFNFLKDSMLSNLNDLRSKHSNSKLYITGHSLGGAMATFAAPAIYEALRIKADQLYTLGAPRVGDLLFSNWWKEMKFSPDEARITHSCDPVPHLPPEAFGFTHIGNEIFYKSFKPTLNFLPFHQSTASFVTCLMPEDPKCANSCQIPGDVIDHLDYFQLDFTFEIPICFA